MIQSALICSPRESASTATALAPSAPTDSQSSFFQMFIAVILACFALLILAKTLFKRDQIAPAFDRNPGRTYQPAAPKSVHLSHKLGKIFNGRAFTSARRRMRRSLLRRRKPRDLDVAQIIHTIDREKFEKIRARYGMENRGEEPPKYLDKTCWIDAHIRSVRDLARHIGARQRSHEDGSYTGYFHFTLDWNVTDADEAYIPMSTKRYE